MRTLLVILTLCLGVSAQTVTEYPIPSGATAGNICARPGTSEEWFVSDAEVGKIDTSTLVVTEYSQIGLTSGLVGCSFSPTGLLWFANQKTFRLYSLDPSTLSLTSLPVPTPNASMAGVIWHSDGLLYIMVSGSSVIRRLNPDNSWASTVTLPASSFPHGPSSCPDGNVWFAMNTANKIAFVRPDGTWASFTLPQASSSPFSTACIASDNATYFTEMAANKIASIDRTTHVITQWSVPATTPKGIAIGADGNVYAALSATNQIGIMPLGGGAITALSAPTPGSSPNKLGLGPDSNIWGSEWKHAAMLKVN